MQQITNKELEDLIKANSKRSDEILSQKDKINIGLTSTDIQNMFNYVCGEAEKPLFVDKFTSDTNDRMKDMLLVMNQLQMAELPILIAYKDKITERLLNIDNLDTMDYKTLSSISANITKEIQTILDTTTKAIQTINQFCPLNSEYRRVLDSLMLVSDEKFETIQRIINSCK